LGGERRVGDHGAAVAVTGGVELPGHILAQQCDVGGMGAVAHRQRRPPSAPRLATNYRLRAFRPPLQNCIISLAQIPEMNAGTAWPTADGGILPEAIGGHWHKDKMPLAAKNIRIG
jgi:hypothetical protein